VSESIFFLCPVPPKGPPPLEVRRIKAHRMNPYHFVVLSPAFWGLYTHWTGNHSHPCFKTKEKCAGCKLKCGRKWLGYLHCVDEDNKHCLVEFTKRAANMLLDSVPAGRILRGIRVAMQRTEGGKNGRLCARMIGIVASPERLPAAQDPEYTMGIVYGILDDLDNDIQASLA
jgi:hypothetical protein